MEGNPLALVSKQQTVINKNFAGPLDKVDIYKNQDTIGTEVNLNKSKLKKRPIIHMQIVLAFSSLFL